MQETSGKCNAWRRSWSPTSRGNRRDGKAKWRQDWPCSWDRVVAKAMEQLRLEAKCTHHHEYEERPTTQACQHCRTLSRTHWCSLHTMRWCELSSKRPKWQTSGAREELWQVPAYSTRSPTLFSATKFAGVPTKLSSGPNVERHWNIQFVRSKCDCNEVSNSKTSTRKKKKKNKICFLRLIFLQLMRVFEEAVWNNISLLRDNDSSTPISVCWIHRDDSICSSVSECALCLQILVDASLLRIPLEHHCAFFVKFCNCVCLARVNNVLALHILTCDCRIPQLHSERVAEHRGRAASSAASNHHHDIVSVNTTLTWPR